MATRLQRAPLTYEVPIQVGIKKHQLPRRHCFRSNPRQARKESNLAAAVLETAAFPEANLYPTAGFPPAASGARSPVLS